MSLGGATHQRWWQQQQQHNQTSRKNITASPHSPSLPLSLYICLSIYLLSLTLSIYVSIFVSFYLSIYQSMYSFSFLSLPSLNTDLCTYLSIPIFFFFSPIYLCCTLNSNPCMLHVLAISHPCDKINMRVGKIYPAGLF